MKTDFPQTQIQSTCKHCNTGIVFKPTTGLWHAPEKTQGISQYCWIDSVKGSQLHQPQSEAYRGHP